MSTKYEDISAEVSAWYEEGNRLAEVLKSCEPTCEVHDMLDTIENGINVYEDES